MRFVDELKSAFQERFGRETAVISRAPGRISLLGAHVDYSEGLVLPATIEQAVWLAAAPRRDGRVVIEAVNFEERGEFRLPSLDVQASSVVSTWLNYPLGVAWALQEAGHTLSGMDVLLISDLPIESGLSSSAAVEMAFVLAWEAVSGLELNGLERAQIGQKTENEYLGVGSGIQDQFACVHGRSNQFVYLDCRTLEHELVPLSAGVETAVILADSGVRRRLASSNYNSRPEECREAGALLQTLLPHIQTLRDVSMDELELYGHELPEHLRRRALHVVGEIERVRQGVAALKQGDLQTFGRLIRHSQISSRDNYESSIPELDLLAATAWRTPGCIGARFGGGGYGGVMQVLVEKTAVPQIQSALAEAFEAEYGRVPPMLVTGIGEGAGLVKS